MEMDFMEIFFISILSLLGLSVVFGITMAIFYNDLGGSNGEHTGYVTAIEFNDNLLWDSTLVYFKTDTESTQEDIYCVNDASLKAQLKELASTKSQITIHYKNPFFFKRSECNGGSSVIVGIK